MISSKNERLFSQVENYRPLLTTYAYNILGTYQEAGDVVQDAYVQLMKADVQQVENLRAYLIRIVINLSINQKHRQKRLRQLYPGEWLPEPVSTDYADTRISKQELLSYSLMVLMERLDARQRAVFILKEAFDYEHAEIGELIGVTAENSRQLLSRAKRQLKLSNSRKSDTHRNGSLSSYIGAIQRGEIERLEQMLKEEIEVISDGGGKARAALNPVRGKASALAYLYGLNTKFYKNKPIHEAEVNYQPALFYFDGEVLTACHIFTFKGDMLSDVHIVRNPDKLRILQKSLPACHAGEPEIVIA